jgi:glutamate carboxypeptidase
MDKHLSELLSFLSANHQLMIEQLHQFCEINSGSDNLIGLAKMHIALEQAFAPIADVIESHDFSPLPTIDMSGHLTEQRCGNLLYIRKRPHLKRRILLSGHMDTVYSSHHPFQTLKYINDNCLNGPGVADMKGGLIVILHALLAFESSPYAHEIGWDVVINADEELGSPFSGSFLSKIAQYYETALVYEPSMSIEGTLAKNRKGSGKFTLIVKGKAAHAGRSFQEGRNAICFLADIIPLIHALNGKRQGVTINIGLIAGGEALNMVPETAVVKLDIRISEANDERWVREQINLIVDETRQEGYSVEIHGHFGRPVKRVNQATEQLFLRVQRLGKSLGLTINWQDSGGCCDGNNLAAHGLPVLDTLGVRGGDIHTSNEFILLDSLVERAALSTLLLIELSQEGM